MKHTIQLIIAGVIVLCTYLMLASSTTSKTEEELKVKLERTEMERDLLSDAIRSHIDRTDGECDILIEVNHFLNVADENLRNFDDWSYCY